MSCPNCQSVRFVETAAKEHCPDCGIEFDYHGKGANAAYNQMLDRLADEERTAQALANYEDTE